MAQSETPHHRSTGHWLALAGLLLAVPGSALAGVQVIQAVAPPRTPPAGTSLPTGPATPDGPQTSAGGGPVPSTGQPTTTSRPSSTPVSGCVVTVDHFAARIHEEPSHRSAPLARVPSGRHDALERQVVPFAGREDVWFLLDVGGRTGWLPYSTVTVAALSPGCR